MARFVNAPREEKKILLAITTLRARLFHIPFLFKPRGGHQAKRGSLPETASCWTAHGMRSALHQRSVDY